MGRTQRTKGGEDGILQGFEVGLGREAGIVWALTWDTQGGRDRINPAHTGMWGKDPAGILGWDAHPGVGCPFQNPQGPGILHQGKPNTLKDKGTESPGDQLSSCRDVGMWGNGIQEGLTQEPQGFGNSLWGSTLHPQAQRQDSMGF